MVPYWGNEGVIMRSGQRVLTRLLAFVAFALALEALVSVVIVAAVEPELPGDPQEPVPSETWICMDCRDWVMPVWPEDGSAPQCPNDPSHTLSPR